MAVFDGESVKGGLVFDLEGTPLLESVAVWNYNKPAYTDRGVLKADVSVWTETGGWKPVVKEAVLLEAEGTEDYDEPTVLTFEPVEAQKVRLDNLVCINDSSKQIGLSKVRFFAPLGPAACNGVPADNAAVPFTGCLPIRWTAGKNALVHAIYLGENPDNLTLRGKISGPARVDVEGLKPDTKYYWSIEEIQEDGTSTKGAVWSFKTGLAETAYWPMDDNANDVCGAFNGTIQGSPQWIEGRYGKALLFDGETNSVEIPPLRIRSNAMTICGWLRLSEENRPFTGIFFCRSSNTATGLNLSNAGTLGYHWRNAAETYGWNSELTIPRNQWVFAAVAIEPSKAALYLWDGKEMKTAVHEVTHEAEQFDMPVQLGRDPADGSRFFKGALDEVRLFDSTLNNDQIMSLCLGQQIAFAAGEIRLVNASFVTEDQSLKEIARQAGQQEASSEGRRKMNWSAVLVILAVVMAIAVVSTFKKKK
jgi:hypothetical protein